jgi:two-component system CheB/CheR fusion protein
MFKRISLTLKMLLITIVVGIATWGFIHLLQLRTIDEAFNNALSQRLNEDENENRILFDRYVKNFNQNARFIISQKQFYDYIKKTSYKEWSLLLSAQNLIKYHEDTPQWLPSPSILSSITHFRYAFLIDDKGIVREVFKRFAELPPKLLLKPGHLLQKLNTRQTLLTSINSNLYLITSETLYGSQGRSLATLMLATPVDSEFLADSQDKDHIMAYVAGENPQILASNRMDLLPAGTLLESLQGGYVYSGKDLSEYGISDRGVNMVTFIPKKPYELLSRSILIKERGNRIVTALLLILSFSFIMLWITKRIQSLTWRVMDFSEKSMNIKQKGLRDGDELKVLDERFRNLTEEIAISHESLKKQAETLRRERDKAQNYLDIAGTIIMALNPKGEITLMNRKGYTILGYEEEEVIGKDWFVNFIPERIRHEVRSVFEKIVTGDTDLLEYYENTVLGKSGEERLIAWHNSVLKDQGGRIIGVLSSGEDVTEHKKLEKSLIEIEERERHRIGQDLHDGLGQLLTGIAFQVRGLGRKLEKSSFIDAEDAAEISVLVDDAKLQVSRISKGLYPVDMDKEGLMTALEELALSTKKMFGIPCVFVCDEPVFIRNKTAVIQLYRIAQEAVTNAVKHGKPHQIEIYLSGTYNKVAMMIKDDGIGIENINGQMNTGLGLKIMRYRANLINASLNIGPDLNGGTLIICDFSDTDEKLSVD